MAEIRPENVLPLEDTVIEAEDVGATTPNQGQSDPSRNLGAVPTGTQQISGVDLLSCFSQGVFVASALSTALSWCIKRRSWRSGKVVAGSDLPDEQNEQPTVEALEPNPS